MNDNRISFRRHTSTLTMLPSVIMEQYRRRLAFVWFTLVSMYQMAAIGGVDGAVTLLPLVMIVVVTLVKEVTDADESERFKPG